jgi:hypothetical protein
MRNTEIERKQAYGMPGPLWFFTVFGLLLFIIHVQIVILQNINIVGAASLIDKLEGAYQQIHSDNSFGRWLPGVKEVSDEDNGA